MKRLSNTFFSLIPASVIIALLMLSSCHKQIDSTYSVSMACDYTVPVSTQASLDSLESGVAVNEVKNTCVKEGINESQIANATVKGIHLSIDPTASNTFDAFSEMDFYLEDVNGKMIKKIGESTKLNNNSKSLNVDITLENITEIVTKDQLKVVWVAKSNKPITSTFVVHASLDIDFTAVIYN